MDLRRSESLSWKLGGALVGLVLAFDLLSIFLPRFAGMEVAPGAVVTAGLVFAFLIVAAIVLSAVYYGFWLKHEDPASQSGPGARPH